MNINVGRVTVEINSHLYALFDRVEVYVLGYHIKGYLVEISSRGGASDTNIVISDGINGYPMNVKDIRSIVPMREDDHEEYCHFG